MLLDSALSAALGAALGLSGLSLPGSDPDSPVVIDGADEVTRHAILELLPKRDAPTTLFEAERIAEDAAERARAWLRSEGYYAAEVTPDAQDNPPSARLLISPGARFKFTAPVLVFDHDAPDGQSSDAAFAALKAVSAEAPARAADVLSAETGAVAALQAAGYADAQAGARRVVVDHATNTVSTEFHVDAGARARLGQLRVAPDDMFRGSFLRRVKSWKEGDLFTPQALTDLRRDVISTGAASRVSTRLAPPDANGVRDVVLEVEPAKRNAYELGVGWSNTDGLGVEAEWTRRNATQRADSLTVGTTWSELSQGVRVELSRPHAAGRKRSQRFTAEVERENTEAYTREGVQISASVDASTRLRTARSYGVSLAANNYSAAAGVENAVVLSGFADLHRDTTERPLDARHGSIVDLRIEPSVSTGDATLAFVRATGEARIYASFDHNDRYTLAARARTGWVEPLSGNAEDIPPDRRFYAGGGGSVRGYGYNSIYPEERDALGLTPGGQGQLEVSVEARTRMGEHWGAAAFVDGGNAFDQWSDAVDLRWGAGFGVRYNLGFAPLRADVAFPLDKREGDADYALYISLGQAF